MKKILLSLTMLFSITSINAQNLLYEDFEVAPPSTWTLSNKSDYPSFGDWDQGISDEFPAQSGNPDSYVYVDYTCAAGNATISNWMFTPTVSIQNGDIISFYTRTLSNPSDYPDRLQMRIGQGANPTAPNGSEGVGGYSILAVDVNPDLSDAGYPEDWTKYSYTVTGFPNATPCKIAFRYYVTNGGTSGDNGTVIAIDTFSVDRNTAGTEDFFMNNFSLFPNPTIDYFTLISKNQTAMQHISVYDINGRIVKEIENAGFEGIQVNVSDLTSGIYFVKINSDLGIGTTKLVKK